MWLGFHLVLTSLPPSSLPPLELGFRVDWLAHLMLGTGLGLLLAWAAGRGSSPARLSRVWVAIALFGAFDEWHQPFFGRTAELMDWVMYVTGGAVGLVLGRWLVGALSVRWQR